MGGTPKLDLYSQRIGDYIATQIERDPSGSFKEARRLLDHWQSLVQTHGETLSDPLMARWEEIVSTNNVQEAVAIMRCKDEGTLREQMRRTSPFVAILPEDVRQRIWDGVYGAGQDD